jgi:anti-anti-sigma factor
MNISSPVPEIGLTFSVSLADGVVVSVAGELDMASAPDLGAVIDALVDRGHLRLAIDCHGLTFIDARGVGMLASAYARLARAGGHIRLHGVTGLPYRVLEITDLLDPFNVRAPLGAAAHEPGDRPGETDPLAQHVARLAEASARADAVAETLSRLTVLIADVIEPCDGASVTLRRHDHLITAAANDETIRTLDRFQYLDGEGPCVEAASTGVQTHVPSLADDPRWEPFATEARARGIEGVVSSPLVVDDRRIGALNLYSRAPGSFDAVHRELAERFAEQAALVLDATDAATAHEFDARIRDALASRDVIAQGQGVLMERLGIDARDAYRTLRRDATEIATTLRRQAAFVVAESQPRPAASGPEGSADG